MDKYCIKCMIKPMIVYYCHHQNVNSAEVYYDLKNRKNFHIQVFFVSFQVSKYADFVQKPSISINCFSITILKRRPSIHMFKISMNNHELAQFFRDVYGCKFKYGVEAHEILLNH